MSLPLLLLTIVALGGAPDIAVSANDGKQVLADGKQVVPDPLLPDSVSILEFGGGKLRLAATIAAPASVIGPPTSVAVTPDGRYAIVTRARRVRPDGKDIEPDDLVSVIDLRERRLVGTVKAGDGASGVAINPQGTRVLVANRSAGTLSLFAFSQGALSPLAVLPVGSPRSSPAQPVFYAGGTRALVTRDGDHAVAMVAIDGERLTLLPRTLATGLRPYPIDVAGRYAVTGNIGGGGRDVDTISLIDLAGDEPVVVDTVSVGLTPEGLKLSRDGRFVAVTVNNGSNAARASRLWSDHGLLQVWRIEHGRLTKAAEAPMGGWGQGIAWSRDGRQILAQAMIGNRIESFGFDGTRLRRGASVTLPAGPAAIATAP